METRQLKKKMNPVIPDHYVKAGQASPIDLIRAYNLNFPIGNVIKYAARYKDKNGTEDLKKALFYLLWELQVERERIKEIIKEIN